MRPDVSNAERMIKISQGADEIAAGHPEEYQDFVRYLAIENEMIKTCNNAPERGWKYRTYQEVVFELGTLKRAALYVPSYVSIGEAKMCYFNAYEAAVNNEDLCYVEGYAEAGLMPVRHAWLEDGAGQIIDPTWAGLDHLNKKHEEFIYYGVRFSTDFITNKAMITGYCSIFDADWRTDFEVLRLGLVTDDSGMVVWPEVSDE